MCPQCSRFHLGLAIALRHKSHIIIASATIDLPRLAMLSLSSLQCVFQATTIVLIQWRSTRKEIVMDGQSHGLQVPQYLIQIDNCGDIGYWVERYVLPKGLFDQPCSF